MEKNRKIIIAAIAGLVVVGAGIGIFFFSGIPWPGSQQVSTEDPMDIVHDFYNPWLHALQSTSTNPFQEKLGNVPYLSKDLRARLKGPQDGVDPVICQTRIPDNISMRKVHQTESEIQVLVTAKKPATSTQQAIVTLLPLNGGWYIDDIECSPGEFAPQREFSFDRDGKLSKNVPESSDKANWHLLFQEEGEQGHFVPLLLSASSTCQVAGGTARSCSPEMFTENAQAHVWGHMTERGVDVRRIDLGK